MLAGGYWVFPLGSLFLPEELEALESLSGWCCTGLGEGQCGQHVATSLTFWCGLSWSLVQGLPQSPPLPLPMC